MKICKEIDAYIKFVRSEESNVCKEQLLLCDLVEDVFKNEKVYVDERQLEKYLKQEKHFPYNLLPWETFCFALHNCVYKQNGQLRFPTLVIVVGRGAGKNGYLAFEDFCLVTPVNGVRGYNIDTFATSEKQAEATFKDIYEILEDNADYFKQYFHWNKERIYNYNTRSEILYHTRAPGTKDGGRPGKINFDEYHAYENYKLINVVVTGLGKRKHPRRTIITTQGDIREGPLDNLLIDAIEVLERKVPDNGMLPFICRLDNDEEIHNKKMWEKANPSLRYFPDLQQEMEIEYNDYLKDPANNSAFPTKRMNRPTGDTEYKVTEWENIAATNQEIPDLKNCNCVAGIDFAKSTDFVVAGLLFKKDGKKYWISHTWVCEKSEDLPRIKYPLKEAEKKGLLTMVKGPEIPATLVTEWLEEQMKKYRIVKVAIDSFRYTYMRDALEGAGFKEDKIKMVRPSDIMKAAVIIGSLFVNHNIVYGDNSLMRWYTRNTKAVTDSKGNTTYEKIEGKSRKTDGFMAYAAAETVENEIKEPRRMGNKKRLNVITG